MKILIVEDDALIARVYSSKYQSSGFQTQTAADGEEGLALLKAFRPDLVHLDLGIPKVDGVQIIQHIRSQPESRSLPVIVLSNTYQNRLVKAAIEAGATQCVSKATCTPKMMVEIVEKVRVRMGTALHAPEAVAALNPTPSASVASDEKHPAGSPAAAPASASSPSPLPASPSPPAVTTDSSVTSETQRQIAFHSEIHDDFLRRAPRMLGKLADRIEPLLRSETDGERNAELAELCQASKSLAGRAGLAGFKDLSQMAQALVALVIDIFERPKAPTASPLRTIVDAVDVLPGLLERVDSPSEAAAPLVLIVDDDLMCRRAVHIALGPLKVATISIEDPQAALRLLEENRFSLIFLDVDMPGMNGFDLCKALRAQPTNQATPVVFVTSQDTPEVRERGVEAGSNDLIAKPFLPMELALRALTLLR